MKTKGAQHGCSGRVLDHRYTGKSRPCLRPGTVKSGSLWYCAVHSPEGARKSKEAAKLQLEVSIRRHRDEVAMQEERNWRYEAYLILLEALEHIANKRLSGAQRKRIAKQALLSAQRCDF